MAVMPYLIVIAVLSLSKSVLPLSMTDITIPWPGLTTVDSNGAVSSLVLNHNGVDPGTTYSFCWLSNCGTLMMIAAIIVTILLIIFNEKGKYSITFKESICSFGHTLKDT